MFGWITDLFRRAPKMRPPAEQLAHLEARAADMLECEIPLQDPDYWNWKISCSSGLFYPETVTPEIERRAIQSLVDGAANIWGALSNRDKDGWWVILLLGVAGVLAGGYALAVPPVSMIVFIYVVAFIAMFVGTTSLYLGWKVRAEIPNEWILYLSGAISVLFALLILFNPEVGGLSVIYLIAAWALLIGALRIWFAFRIRAFRDRIDSGASA